MLRGILWDQNCCHLEYMEPRLNDFFLEFNVVTILLLRVVLLLAIAHSYWHHSGFPQIHILPDLVRDKFVPIVQTEEQLLFVFHLVSDPGLIYRCLLESGIESLPIIRTRLIVIFLVPNASGV